jgi:hypothetical protein
VRDKIGPVAAFKTVMVVKRLPKTRSGKILRATMQKIADGEAWKMPATIDDPAILDEISEVLAKRGIKKSDGPRFIVQSNPGNLLLIERGPISGPIENRRWTPRQFDSTDRTNEMRA